MLQGEERKKEQGTAQSFIHEPTNINSNHSPIQETTNSNFFLDCNTNTVNVINSVLLEPSGTIGSTGTLLWTSVLQLLCRTAEYVWIGLLNHLRESRVGVPASAARSSMQDKIRSLWPLPVNYFSSTYFPFGGKRKATMQLKLRCQKAISLA